MSEKLRDIEALYEGGTAPSADDFCGEYYVTAPCFPWFSLELLKHRKAIGSDGSGLNAMLFGSHEFGRFILEDKGDHLLINYDQPENSAVMKGVVDRLRVVDGGRIIGKLYYRIFGVEIFLMYFEMKKKED